MRAEKELKQIAIDIHGGRIFTDRHCKSEEEVKLVFMPLLFIFSSVEKREDKVAQLKETVERNRMKKQLSKAAMIYEYMDKAGPMGINGMPIFMSFYSLEKEELTKVDEYHQKICEALDKI